MKTIKKIFTAITLFIVAVAVTGCFASGEVTKLSIDKMPSTTFEVGTTKIDNLMTIVINDDAEYRLTLSWENNVLHFSNSKFENKIILEGFDLSRAGSYTASVKYNSSVSYFDYQVLEIESLFAGGDGTYNNPYQITNASNFCNINNVKETEGIYFKLMNDIDMSSATVNQYFFSAYVGTFEGILDGNNKKIYNVGDPVGCIFNELSGSTIKNLDVYFQGADISLSGMANSYKKTILFDNVDLYGTVTPSRNYGGYFSYPMTQKYSSGRYSLTIADCSFIDCDTHVSIICTDQYTAGFVGCPAGNYSFDNCWNYGYIEAPKVAVFFCNDYIYSQNHLGDKGYFSYTITNSGNYGTLSSIVEVSNGILAAEGARKATIGTVDFKVGERKQIPKFDFASLAKLENGKLAFKQLTDPTISKIAVSIFMPYVKYTKTSGEGGTAGAYLTKEYSVTDGVVGTNGITDFYISNLKVNEGRPVTIKEIVEGKNANDWLEYKDGSYVYDETKVMENAVCKKASPSMYVYAYNNEGNLIYAYIIQLKEE